MDTVAREAGFEDLGQHNLLAKVVGVADQDAAGLGQAFSVLLIAGGLFQIIAFQTLWPLWYVVLGLFLGQAARGAVMQTAFAEKLGDVKVEDIMDREPVAAPADLDAERVLDEFFHRYRWSWFPVVDETHRFVNARAAPQARPTVAPGGYQHNRSAGAARIGRSGHELVAGQGQHRGWRRGGARCTGWGAALGDAG